MAGGREEWKGVTEVGASGSCQGRGANLVSITGRAIFTTFDMAHLVVARDQIGEQLRYDADHLARVVA